MMIKKVRCVDCAVALTQSCSNVNYNQSQEDRTIIVLKKKDVLKIFYIKPSLKLDQSCIRLGLLLQPFFDLDMKRDPKKKT